MLQPAALLKEQSCTRRCSIPGSRAWKRSGSSLCSWFDLTPTVYLNLEELDSYLYQTVGQDAIELVAHALEVPLYRRVISGDALEQGSEYGGRNAKDAGGVDGDETEDLHALLSTVKVYLILGLILSKLRCLVRSPDIRIFKVCR